MRFDFSSLPLKDRAFSQRPMAFMDQEAKNFLSAILDLAAIETGNRVAREYWQQRQLQNLVAHAAERSPIWRRRIGAAKISGINLGDLPVQTRADVVEQVTQEGALARMGEAGAVKKHSTSGSSGTPVEFYATERNVFFNLVRSIGQYFLEDADLSQNLTSIRQKRIAVPRGFETQKEESWIPALRSLLHTGIYKYIEYLQPDMDALCEELARDSLGYVTAQPWFMEMVVQHAGPEFFKAAGAAVLTPIGEAMGPALRKVLASAGVPVRANYSSEEMGPIAHECERALGCFHVAASNVIVEVVYDGMARVDGKRCGRVLVTALHSYATPFIRYDLGDVASLEDRCACGHDGPTLSNIYGRDKTLLKRADGRLSVFYIGVQELLNVARFEEFRIRQVSFNKIVVEIGGRESLTDRERNGLDDVIRGHAGSDFDVEIKSVRQIDWGKSTKRLGFRSEV